MDELQKRIAQLATDYLLKVPRGHDGRFDHSKQAKALLGMLSAEHVSEIFSYEEADSLNRLQEYERMLQTLLENREERAISWANQFKRDIFERAVVDLLNRMSEEFEIAASAKDAWRLKQRIADLEVQVEFGKSADAVTFWDRLNTRVNFPYLVILCLSVALIGGLVIIGMTATMTVNVTFSVGEIIGALLVGTGVAAAGVSYATRNRSGREERNE